MSDLRTDRPVREDGNTPTLPVAAVARRLGVAPATLRTWDRRYGLGPRAHTSGRHRRYGPADIARLEVMRSALLRGASSAEAARYALESERSGADPAGMDGTTGPDGTAVGIEVWPPPARSPDRLPGGSRLGKGLCRAARAMDTLALRQLLGRAIAECGVLGAWQDIIEPVLGALADGYTEAPGALPACGPEVTQLLGECVLAELVRATPEVHTPRMPRPVLLCCASGKGCGLPLYVVDAALCQRGVATRLLGAALPPEALRAAVERTGASAVALWAQHPSHATPGVFGELAAMSRSPRLLACGPGWDAAELGDGVHTALGVHSVVARVLDGGH